MQCDIPVECFTIARSMGGRHWNRWWPAVALCSLCCAKKLVMIDYYLKYKFILEVRVVFDTLKPSTFSRKYLWCDYIRTCSVTECNKFKWIGQLFTSPRMVVKAKSTMWMYRKQRNRNVKCSRSSRSHLNSIYFACPYVCLSIGFTAYLYSDGERGTG